MKKTILSLTFVLFNSMFNSAQEMSLENVKNSVFDLEKIQKGTTEKEILIQNFGKKPLIISNVSGSCGCSVADFPKVPILPNKNGIIKVRFKSSQLGFFSKSLTIFSNDKNKKEQIIQLKGEVSN